MNNKEFKIGDLVYFDQNSLHSVGRHEFRDIGIIIKIINSKYLPKVKKYIVKILRTYYKNLHSELRECYIDEFSIIQ